jgi:hypothetical protein
MANTRQPVIHVRECRFCHCTPEHPCRVPGGDECAFLGAKADRCSAPGCVVAFEAEYDLGIARERSRSWLIRQLSSKGKKKQHHKRRAA